MGAVELALQHTQLPWEVIVLGDDPTDETLALFWDVEEPVRWV